MFLYVRALTAVLWWSLLPRKLKAGSVYVNCIKNYQGHGQFKTNSFAKPTRPWHAVTLSKCQRLLVLLVSLALTNQCGEGIQVRLKVPFVHLTNLLYLFSLDVPIFHDDFFTVLFRIEKSIGLDSSPTPYDRKALPPDHQCTSTLLFL